MLFSIAMLITAGAFEPVVTQQLEAPNGLPSMQVGLLSEPLTGELSSAVTAWSLSQRPRFGVPATSALKFSHAFATRFGASFHLVQQFEGVDIDSAKLVVTLDEQGRVVQTSSSLSSYAFARNEWNLDEPAAMQKAAAGVVLPMLRSDGSSLPYGGAKKTYFTIGAELHAGYLVHVASLDYTKNWYVGVDAVTGERLFVQNRVHTALDTNVYPISPGGLDAGVGATPTSTVQLRHADGGSMVANTCDVFLPDGGWEVKSNPTGELCGHQMTQYNCCPREGCRADAGTKRENGLTTYSLGPSMSLQVQYSIAVCDRLRRASPEHNDAGANYQYTPVDPPKNAATVVLDDPSNSDEFAETHAFYHVNRVYDWVRSLSSTGQVVFAGQPAVRTFAMRDERRMPARKPAIWSNVMFPNFDELQTNVTGFPGCLSAPPCMTHADTLIRLDNAAFFPRENFDQLPVPGFDTGVDTLMIFQGNAADAAYDSTVIQHEFGHGVVYATAELSFSSVAFDSRSANNEGGAMHEAFSDYIAAAFNDVAEIGVYFGPRVYRAAGQTTNDEYLRTLNNTFTCPEVLWGEVHQDALHVAAALWAGRNALRGTDNGNTYDAAFYAMLVSIAPTADFAEMAAAMTARVKQAFPTVPTAEAQMTAIFQTKGIIGCSKVIDVTGATAKRAVYQISQAPNVAATALVPGPYQFKLRVPNGATRVRITSQAASSGGLGGTGGAPRVTALLKANSPITFTKAGAAVTNDATKTQQLSNGATPSANIDFAVPCGASSEIYVSLSAAGATATLGNVSVAFDAPASCSVTSTDGGTMTTGDGGTGQTSDGGTQGQDGVKTLPAVGANSTASATPAKTCGCSTAEFGPMLALALATLALRRRKGSFSA